MQQQTHGKYRPCLGFVTIGRGMLPLLERYFKLDRDRCYILDPSDKEKHPAESKGLNSFRQSCLRTLPGYSYAALN
ncbi:MAG: hypothetical protein JWO78_534 [Micavibrio sp.]|nr:hypothetical protein [Micavibrio sp.]